MRFFAPVLLSLLSAAAVCGQALDDLAEVISPEVRGLLELAPMFLRNAVGIDLEEVLEAEGRSLSSTARAWGMEECSALAVCSSHARYDEYGYIALPFRFLFSG